MWNFPNVSARHNLKLKGAYLKNEERYMKVKPSSQLPGSIHSQQNTQHVLSILER
jgi:hypothetical protein